MSNNQTNRRDKEKGRKEGRKEILIGSVLIFMASYRLPEAGH